MKKFKYPEAIHRAVDEEYDAKAPEELRLKIRALMRFPLVKPWQFIGSAALLLATPLCLSLFNQKLIYSSNMLLILNVASGVAAFLIIFAGVAHRYQDPKDRADLLDKLAALRAKI